MDEIRVRTNDNESLQYKILDYEVDENGVSNLIPVVLTDKAVLFSMIREGDTEYTVLNQPCSIIDALDAIVNYDFASYETATRGFYKASWKVVDGSKVSTYPKYDQQWIHIYDDSI